MPLDKGEVEAEPPEKDPPQSEQHKWEADQMSSAQFKFGAKDKKGLISILFYNIILTMLRLIKTSMIANSYLFIAKEEYELILEDEVEFVHGLQMTGDKKEKRPEITETERKLISIEETQKSLPIYPFKKELIEAIKSHQVSN